MNDINLRKRSRYMSDISIRLLKLEYLAYGLLAGYLLWDRTE